MYLERKAPIEELLKRCLKKDPRAQEALYRRFSSRMFAVCLRYASDQMEAQDILQMAFIKMFSKIGDFRMEGSFEGWLRRITITTGLEFCRRRTDFVQFGNELSTAVPCSETLVSESLEADHLLGLIRDLAPGYRIVFNLYAIDGYSHKEIAVLLNISEGTSKSQLARAREQLKKHLLVEEQSYGYRKG